MTTERLQQQSQGDKKSFWREVIIILITGVVTSYFSVIFYGKELEKYKMKMIFEEKNVYKKLEANDKIIRKAAELFQLAALHKQAALVGIDKAPLLSEAINKQLTKQRVSDIDLIEVQKSFQIELFSQKPYLEQDVYEKLSIYGILMNDFNRKVNSQEQLLEKYRQAGQLLNDTINLIRVNYGLKNLPNQRF